MLLPPPPHPLENWPELSEDLTLWDTGRKLKKMFSRHFRAQKTGSGPQVRGQTDGHTDTLSSWLPPPTPPAHASPLLTLSGICLLGCCLFGLPGRA